MRRLFENPNCTDPHVKANALLQAHFSRQSITTNLEMDQREVLLSATRLLQAMVDVISSNGWLNLALLAMEASQMVTQGMWERDSMLLQLPHFTKDLAKRCQENNIETVFDLVEMEDEERQELLKMKDTELLDIARFCNRFPNIDLTYEVVGSEDVTAGKEVTLQVMLERDMEGRTEVGAVDAPRYPKTKEEGWWLVVGDTKTNQLVAIKRVSLQKKAKVKLDFQVPSEADSHLFGEANLIRSPDDRSVRLLLDKYTGSGFISSNMYQHGFFSSLIKLPGAYTAGLVVAFYTSNGDVFVKNHDELDIEFLGNVEGKPWRFQTNMYGNGSTNRGREERYRLWFDPSKEFHRYSILWNPTKIIFWVDDVPIREIIRKEEMKGDYPQKPMSLYATIWDASSWATSGGKFGVDYAFSPFVSEFKDVALDGCNVSDSFPNNNNNNTVGYNYINCSASDQDLMTSDYSTISPKQAAAMRRFRERYMYYSYCYDTVRYAVPPPECVIVTAEKDRFRDTGRLKFGGSHRARKRRKRNRSTPVVSADQ